MSFEGFRKTPMFLKQNPSTVSIYIDQSTAMKKIVGGQRQGCVQLPKMQ